MRVPALMGNLALGACVCTVALMTVPAWAGTAKIACPCDCPEHQKPKPRRAESPRHYVGAHYSYRDAMPVHWRAWQGPRATASVPGEPAGLVIDQGGWTGGVGYGADGGGGYGQLLLVNGAGQNGPANNSLGESFQSNPSMPHPFQNRLMGRIAPAR